MKPARPARRTRVALRTAVCAVVLAAAATACGGSGSGSDTGAGTSGTAGKPGKATSAPGTLSLKVADSAVGQVLEDSAGHTLYAFAKDKDVATSTCSGACIATWPAFTAKGNVGAGSGLDGSLVGSAPRGDGASQVSYGKWPLYYYAGDTAPGTLNGEGVDDVWFAVSPQGKLVRTGGTAPSDTWQSVGKG
ncbi:hypothetical protein [Streptomyces lydicus]|uniref:hypothetical protein n=1 Tax=Streptomyces lydicus TaxID=47763 RepID=UPI0037A0DEAE